MEQPRNKQNLSKKKPDLFQNPQLTTAQMTLGRTAPIKTTINAPNINPIEVMEQAQQLWKQNDNLESINLLKGLVEYLKGTKYSDQQIVATIRTNLAISYYKIGFLQQAQEQFNTTLSILKDLGLALKNQTIKIAANIAKSSQKVKYQMLMTKIQLQTCILYSQMGKHEQALIHARISCKQAYNLIYDIQIIQYQQLISLLIKSKSAYAPNLDYQISCQGHENLLNNIAIIDLLIIKSQDLRKQFVNKQKVELLQDQKQALCKSGKINTKSNLQLLYALTPQNVDSLWIYKNKILDEIQMKFVDVQIFDTKNFLLNNQVIQKVVYLTISLYCYSTETRFLEKKKQNGDPSQVLDSQHWLSRSLQIAYTFLPQQAPILNQILTVHDRFHGIDKQTIPEDKQVGGFFKVLRPLSKPKSSYNNKNTMCSPIMIRIQVPKCAIQVDQSQNQQVNSHQDNEVVSSKMTIKNIDFANKTIDLENITKNNKIRGLNGSKKYDLTQISQSTIKNQYHTKIDFTQNLKNIYASRKIKSVVENNKPQRMKVNITGIINNEDVEGIKSMRRPHSYDKQIDKQQQIAPIQTQRKKKSSSLSKKDHQKRRRSVISNSTGLKLDGLQMLPNPFKKSDEEDAFQFGSISGKISNLQKGKMGGNIFINNNINLFISKQSLQQSQLNTKKKDDKTMFEVSRRQNFINKRKAHNSNLSGIKNLDFIM